MREYTLSYDASLRKMIFLYKCRLVKKHKSILENLMSDPEMSDYDLEFINGNLIRFILPFEIDPEEVKAHSKAERDTEIGTLMTMKLPTTDADELSSLMEKVQRLIYAFENQAMREETKNLEFIPLSGYPSESIQEDVKAAFENKRDFCVITTMDSYNEFSNTATLCQALYKYGTDEYNNILLAGLEGNIDEIKRITSGWLKVKEYL